MCSQNNFWRNIAFNHNNQFFYTICSWFCNMAATIFLTIPTCCQMLPNQRFFCRIGSFLPNERVSSTQAASSAISTMSAVFTSPALWFAACFLDVFIAISNAVELKSLLIEFCLFKTTNQSAARLQMKFEKHRWLPVLKKPSICTSMKKYKHLDLFFSPNIFPTELPANSASAYSWNQQEKTHRWSSKATS